MAGPANCTRPDRLRRMVDVIVDDMSPDQIILFGSQARGDATAASDVDLLVIVDESFLNGRGRVDVMTQLWRVLSDIQGPKDVLVYSREEVGKLKEASNHVIPRALREGEILYEFGSGVELNLRLQALRTLRIGPCEKRIILRNGSGPIRRSNS